MNYVGYINQALNSSSCIKKNFSTRLGTIKILDYPINMKPLNQFTNPGIRFVFTDIDDTITDDGKLPDRSYKALWELYNQGISVIPVTGRPAGWCEMIARFWPVAGIVGENGGFYFRYKNKKMFRHFAISESTMQLNRKKLDEIRNEVLEKVPGSAVASDQFCRIMDLAIDFCEDVPKLKNDKVQEIVKIFEKHGAQAKVSSIHVNGWFGTYDKLSMCKEFMKKEHGYELDKIQNAIAFVGDSPNDEPMFAFFKNSFAVENIKNFVDQLKSKPAFVTTHSGSRGFCAIADKFLIKPEEA